MKNLVTIFTGAVVLGAVGFCFGAGVAYVSGEFVNPENVRTPLTVFTGMWTIVGGCFGAMRNDLRNNPRPKI